MRFILHGTICKKCICTKKTREWTLRESEFEKRAGFVIIAAYCMADKNADNEVFTQLLPLINRAAIDDRLYVKKLSIGRCGTLARETANLMLRQSL